TPFNQILKQNAKREMRLRLGKVTVADVLAAQPVTTNLLKFMRASIKMIGVSNLQSFIASMTQKLTLSDISDESKNYLDRKSGSAGMPRPISYAVFCLKKKTNLDQVAHYALHVARNDQSIAASQTAGFKLVHKPGKV